MKRDSVLHVRLLSVQGKPVLTSRSSSAVKRVCGLSYISDRNPIDVIICTYILPWLEVLWDDTCPCVVVCRV